MLQPCSRTVRSSRQPRGDSVHFTQTKWTGHRRASVLRNLTARFSSRGVVDADVVVVGAGIIGLWTARKLLEKKLSVALVDSFQPSAGATGAGQGYLWLAHRDPTSPLWALAVESCRSWDAELKRNPRLYDLASCQECGSLLLASNSVECISLATRKDVLSSTGVVTAELWSRDEVLKRQPALKLPGEGAALYVKQDFQLNGRATSFALLAECRVIGGSRFIPFMMQPFQNCHRRDDGWELECRDGRKLRAQQALVLAAGVWSGQLLSTITNDQSWSSSLAPRRGQLLEFAPPLNMPPLTVGTMETSYTKHYTSAERSGGPASQREGKTDITFTATTSATGSLLIGSSRESGQWTTAADPSVTAAVMERARMFLPHLKSVPLSNISVRVGLRPASTRGLPLIGPIPGQPGLFVAAGHEGSGLTLGPATADLISQYVMGEKPKGSHSAAFLP